MKICLLVVILLFANFAFVSAQDKQYKFKAKGDRVELRDKSRDFRIVRGELEAVFAETVRAIKNKDAEAQIAQLSPDYIATQANGDIMNYEQIAAYIRRGANQFVTIGDVKVTIESLTVSGNEATVDARQYYPRTQRLKDGLIHDVLTGVVQREIWVKTAVGWKLRSVDNLREKTVMVDGKPFDPNK